MSHTPHDLTEDFPNHAEQIHRLKQEDAHFRKLAETYHAVNRKIHRVETNIEPMDDVGILELRRQRVRLKDQIARLLAPSPHGA